MTFRSYRVAAAVALVSCAGPTAAAQDPVPRPPATVQPASAGVIVEPIKDRYVFAPEGKITEVDGDTAVLVGGYGGVLWQESVLFGGGVYTLPNGANDTELTYGGLVIGFVLGDQRRISYGVRGLIGAGRGEVTDTIAFGRPTHQRPGPRGSSMGDLGTLVVSDVTYEEAFMVFEPQADLNVRLGGDWRLTFGLGYRLTSASEYLDDRMQGVSGTVAIRFGGAK